MFMHIGNDQVIQTDDIIVMINQQDIEVSSINEEMIDYAEQEDDELSYDEDVVKTIIFTKDGVYYSPLAIQTLKKRTSIKAILSQQESY
ncbi:hypothetical protein GCM10012290_02300 [Halolactibacillus alkaliphilus]|uniref:DUF370 domain-containing protein n=1 Tax=Halolactibacillus alkaliphilus TaxID=442899 RepID=A0A511X0C6_9BACI|nr:extracellular matrix/biofilm biosynthesis regulator RemA family protein [Halolactibacillus alkaliphilus]GEN56402.1 hypothetical protein HAL01_08660 [Halolactibacillus alkaliphilus]GGN64613.1 hypothetical protein GCM10012290_02300 [Halolactibacillus alkaliphilus]SFO60738.1 protein of unknown function [Halolactibacillus alkaliphilus]